MHRFACTAVIGICTVGPVPWAGGDDRRHDERPAAAADDKATKEGFSTGKVRFVPVAGDEKIAERYRLKEHEFPFAVRLKRDLSSEGFQVFEVTFPSPVTTRWKENNTVHAEYYRPLGKGPFPAVIVLDILAGDQIVSRMQAVALVREKVAALVVYMPYYGPRRPKEVQVRMLTPDVGHTLDAVKQTVLDLRRATAWLEAQPEINGKRLGIIGTSLGSFMAALTAEMEPRLGTVALLLGGGNLVEVFYDDPRMAAYRKVWEWLGGNRKNLAELLAPADPITFADNLKGRKLLMLNARRDDVVPPKATEALWRAAGEPKIVWFDSSHVGAALFLIPAMQHVTRHFTED